MNINLKQSKLFVVWKIYQRRAESLSNKLDFDVRYFHYSWEEKSKLHKLVSYIFKSIATIKLLIEIKPNVLIVQLPPTILLYIATLYSWMSGAKLICDCHNAMIDGVWRKLPYAVSCLDRADAVLVHNPDICEMAQKYNIKATVSRDPLPDISGLQESNILDKHSLQKNTYVLVPWNFASDEPLGELMDTAKLCPDIIFVATWFSERLPENILKEKPKNMLFTGYLNPEDFNYIISCAGLILALTTREGTQLSSASEAIAYEVPLVISDMQLSRSLYGDKVVYVENYPDSILVGIRDVLNNYAAKQHSIAELKRGIEKELDSEIEAVKQLLVDC